jgi:hypothetical protein
MICKCNTVYKPVSDMKIELSKAGEIRFERPGVPRIWNVSDSSHPDVFQSTIFAGEQMVAYGFEDDDADELTITAPFTLSYFGFKATDFATMEEAKAAAPEFAREVLRRMIEII